MAEKSPFRFEVLPEVFVSRKDIASAVSKAVKAGKLRKLASRLYTKNMTENPEKIVKRNWYTLLKEYFPDALIADRTALENRPAEDGSVFLISSGTQDVELPGIIFKPRNGHPPLENDRLFVGGIRLCSIPRAWLENMRPSRTRHGAVSRTLTKAECEERLDKVLRTGGEESLNKLRDEARAVSGQLSMEKEFNTLDAMMGALLGTREAVLKSDIGQARKKGLSYDPARVDLFIKLFDELRSTAPVTRQAGHMSGTAKVNLAFFEAYFSNYIEGTEFEVEEAVDIVFNGIIPEDRPEDAHDVLGTYRIVSDQVEMKKLPKNIAALISLLKGRHAAFMEMRPDKKPGEFKTVTNRFGTAFFVAPDLVLGTLEKGFEIYQSINEPLSRAIFMMFMVSEIHPFVDGNGRAARIMMNAELVAAGEQKIIIPTIYRNNYLSALRALTQNSLAEPLIRALDFAQKYTAAISWDDFETARENLQSTHAFMNANEAENKGLRLILQPQA